MHHSRSIIQINGVSTAENTPIKVQCFMNKPVQNDHKIYRQPHGCYIFTTPPAFLKTITCGNFQVIRRCTSGARLK